MCAGPRKEAPHLRRGLESLPAVDRLAEPRRVKQHHADSAVFRPAHGRPHDAGRMPLASVARLGEHRQEIRRAGAFPMRPRLDGHHPNTAAGDRGVPFVDDETDEPPGADARPRPPSVHAVGGVEGGRGHIGDRLPHPAPMPHEEVQVLQGRSTDAYARHVQRFPQWTYSLRALPRPGVRRSLEIFVSSRPAPAAEGFR